MKILSLWQPWATLIAIGAKKIETRSWSTAYRGPIAIHAAKHWDAESLRTCGIEPFRSVLSGSRNWGTERPVCPLGAILCVVDLKHCIPTKAVNLYLMPDEHAEHEWEFGNYDVGRYAWALSNLRPLREPISHKGGQGLRNLPSAVEQKVMEQI